MGTIDKSEYNSFFKEVKEKIFESQLRAMRAVNKELIELYNEVGRMIVDKQEGLGWGNSVVETLADDLQKEFPGMQGFSSRNLWSMRSFYLEYKDNAKLQPLVAEVSWSHNTILISKCKDPR